MARSAISPGSWPGQAAPAANRGTSESMSRLKIARPAPMRRDEPRQLIRAGDALQPDYQPRPLGIQVEKRRKASLIADPCIQPEGHSRGDHLFIDVAMGRLPRDGVEIGQVEVIGAQAIAYCGSQFDRGATRLPNAAQRSILIPTTADGMDGHALLQVEDWNDAEAHGRDHISDSNPRSWSTNGSPAEAWPRDRPRNPPGQPRDTPCAGRSPENSPRSTAAAPASW